MNTVPTLATAVRSLRPTITARALYSPLYSQYASFSSKSAPQGEEGADTEEPAPKPSSNRPTSVIYGGSVDSDGKGPFSFDSKTVREASARMNSMAWGGLVTAAGLALGVRYYLSDSPSK